MKRKAEVASHLFLGFSAKNFMVRPLNFFSSPTNRTFHFDAEGEAIRMMIKFIFFLLKIIVSMHFLVFLK